MSDIYIYYIKKKKKEIKNAHAFKRKRRRSVERAFISAMHDSCGRLP